MNRRYPISGYRCCFNPHPPIKAGEMMIQRRGWLNDEECDRLNTAYERIVGAVAYVECSHG